MLVSSSLTMRRNRPRHSCGTYELPRLRPTNHHCYAADQKIPGTLILCTILNRTPYSGVMFWNGEQAWSRENPNLCPWYLSKSHSRRRYVQIYAAHIWYHIHFFSTACCPRQKSTWQRPIMETPPRVWSPRLPTAARRPPPPGRWADPDQADGRGSSPTKPRSKTQHCTINLTLP